jgi:hypothetical protein
LNERDIRDDPDEDGSAECWKMPRRAAKKFKMNDYGKIGELDRCV